MSDFYTLELMGWKGLDTSPNIASKDPTFAEDCQNVEFDEQGMVIKRRGTQRVSTTFTQTIHFIYDFQSQKGFKNSEDKHRIVVISGSMLYVLNDDYSIDAVFPADPIIHYGVTADNGVCYISSERSTTYPFMLCYGGAE